jgi:hypothetical protein
VLARDGQRYENVEIFKYLGSLVTYTNEVQTEIKARIIANTKCHHALGHIVNKGYMYNTLIKSMSV